MLRAGVIGAGGFAGIELVRFVLTHPEFELVAATSDSMAGTALAQAYPALESFTDLYFEATDHESLASRCDIVFLAVPHTAAMSCVPLYHRAGLAVIDLSADFRIHDPQTYSKWYGCKHSAADLLNFAVYGQPEIHRDALEQMGKTWRESSDASTAPVVACAGCYPTATILACLPALEAGLVLSSPIIVNAMSGVSGAGRSANSRTHFCSAHESVQAYSVCAHRHTPEIEQELSELAGDQSAVLFTPHLVPMKRGLLSTVTMSLVPDTTTDELLSAYSKRYENECFVQFIGESMPQTSAVLGSNHAQVGIAVDSRLNMLVASCAIDNLGKGAASQAIQCANIVCGFEESCGLDLVHPVV